MPRKRLNKAPGLLILLVITFSPVFTVVGRGDSNLTKSIQPGHSDIKGPYWSDAGLPYVFNGDLRSLPQPPPEKDEVKTRLEPPLEKAYQSDGNESNRIDPVVQSQSRAGEMPAPLANFAGLDFLNYGSGWPPDPNGDVGPNHYVQLVNTSIGIYSKATGEPLLRLTLNSFFQQPPGSPAPCNTSNRGDPIVLYDPTVDRWLVTDFAWVNQNTGPFYECIALSQSGDPVSGGWYYWALRADTDGFTGYLNDYPKLGVWSDGWYMTANMFQQAPPGTGFGVRVWALNRAAMLSGGSLQEVHFDLCTSSSCASLLPSNLRGASPPAGSPNYLLTAMPPDRLWLYKFHVDWNTQANSTLTGPHELPVAPYSFPPDQIPQLGVINTLDSLGFRLMMQLQYRRVGATESLWANHTVGSGGIAGIRWYEIHDPNGNPVVFQQGTYQPDIHNRWIGSIAADQDGNMALGYSVSSETMNPAIRYAGRLKGETPGVITQAETALINGSGSQTNTDRWGDYSALTVDPTDDCTFWYTNEYYVSNGSSWLTRIGSFKFPSCGQPKAFIQGIVRNSVTHVPVQGVPIVLSAAGQILNVLTDTSGYYTATLQAGTFSITAGPLQPGYPNPAEVNGVVATTGNVVTQDISLIPSPYLVEGNLLFNDPLPNGNANGFVEPGETSIRLLEGITNAGAMTATQVTARLDSLTPGVSVESNLASYPDIPPGGTRSNSTPFEFSVPSGISCGTDILFQKTVTNSVNVNIIPFKINASIPLPPADVINYDVETGTSGWTTGGTSNWGITTSQSHSPTHSWTDSPAGNYPDNTNSYLRSPLVNLADKRHIQIQFWTRYDLESGYDFVYLDYSINGGATWSNDDQALAVLNGVQNNWNHMSLDAPVLEGQGSVALRFRLTSDAGVNFDGIYLDDVRMTYEPYTCVFHPFGTPRIFFPVLEKN